MQGARAVRDRRTRRRCPVPARRGSMPVRQQVEEPLHDERPTARMARARACSRAAEASPGRRRRAAGRPTPTAWLTRRFSCSRAVSAWVDECRRECPEPGRDAVDDLARGDESFDDVRALRSSRARAVSSSRAVRPRPRHGLDVGDGRVRRRSGRSRDRRVGSGRRRMVTARG